MNIVPRISRLALAGCTAACLSMTLVSPATAGSPGPLTAECDVVRVSPNSLYTLITHAIGGYQRGDEEGGLAHEWMGAASASYVLNSRPATCERTLAPGRYIVLTSPRHWRLQSIIGTTVGEPAMRGTVRSHEATTKAITIDTPWGNYAVRKNLPYVFQYDATTRFQLDGLESTPAEALRPWRKIEAVRERPLTLMVLSESAAARRAEMDGWLVGVVKGIDELGKNRFEMTTGEGDTERVVTITIDRLGIFLLDCRETTPEQAIVPGVIIGCQGARTGMIIATSNKPGDRQGVVESYDTATRRLVITAAGAETATEPIELTDDTPVYLDLSPTAPATALQVGREVTILEHRPSSVDVFSK